MTQSDSPENKVPFKKKVWVAGFCFALIACLLLLFQQTIHVFILIIVGVLFSCYFRGLGKWIEQRTKLSAVFALVASVLGTFLLFSLFFYLIGNSIAQQTSELGKSFPELMDKAEEFLSNTEVGKELVAQFDALKDSEKLQEMASDVFKTTFGGFGDLYIILLIGIYFMISPKVYKEGLISLVPPKNKHTARRLIERITVDLTKWLFGRILAMSLVFVLTAIALAIVGLPMWLALAFIAGFLVFIPNFGPVIASIPALLVALSENVNTMIVVAIIYLVIQVSEGSFITPKLQNRLIKIPPALIILGQVFAGVLVGVWGLIFATPLVLIILVTVQELYSKPMNKRAGKAVF